LAHARQQLSILRFEFSEKNSLRHRGVTSMETSWMLLSAWQVLGEREIYDTGLGFKTAGTRSESDPLPGTCSYDSDEKNMFCMNRLLTPRDVVRIGKLHPVPVASLNSMNPCQRLVTVTNSSRLKEKGAGFALILG